MSGSTVLLSNLVQPVGLRGDPSGAAVVVALRDGSLLQVDLATGQQTVVAQLPGRIACFDLSADGQTAYVAGNAIGLWETPLDGSPPTRLIRSLRTPKAVAIDPLGQLVLVAEGRPNGRLLQLDLTSAQLSVVGRRLARARGMVFDPDRDRAIVADQDLGALVAPNLTTVPTTLIDNLGEPVDLAWHDPEHTHLLVADTAGGRILSADLRQPTNPANELASGLTQLRAAQPAGTDTIAMLTGTSIVLVDLPPVAHPPVELAIPPDELFISGWVRAKVIINDPAIGFDDLDFTIEPNEGGALVSNSRDNSFDSAAPTVLISAGWQTGVHKLVATSRIDGSELARVPFEVMDTWTHPTLGPSIATFGEVISGPDEGTWGGPDSGDYTVPQNVKVHPALGTRNVAVVLVETAEPNGQYPTGAALTTLINNLRDELVNGVAVGGQTRSVTDYFASASNGKFKVNVVGPVGPIALPNGWTSYFRLDSGRWRYNEDVDATVIAEIVARNEAAAAIGASPFLDLSSIDSIIYVIRSAMANPPTTTTDRFVWPRASRSSKVHTIGTDEIPVPWGSFRIPKYRGIARVFMPDDWETRDNGAGNRRFHETASHELCHNLGLLDQYNKGYVTAIRDRLTAQGSPRWTWELMANERNLPLHSAAHRLMLGWLDPSVVKLFNFGTFGAADEFVTLRAVAAGPPAPGSGHFSAIEVRLEDGLNYYFEYRPAVTGAIVDSNSPEAFAVLGTEALTRSPTPTDRAQILLVEDDDDAIDEQGSFIQSQDFIEKDTSTPAFENDFIVDIVSTNATTAVVRVRYAADNKPDPGMTPWSPNTNWQSPDIKVVNGRSKADKSYENIPWEGHDNWVEASVSNRGLSDAHQVTVDFFSLDFTFGGGAETGMGSQTLDVPIGLPVVFTSPKPWRPPQLSVPIFDLTYKQHACFGARFGPFHDPVSGIWEVTTENNVAQSNYTWMASTTHSPATREVTAIWAENPYDEPAVISFAINQPHPLFRVYLDHRWVYLQPGERQRILLMVESLLGDQRFDDLVTKFPSRERLIETKVRLSALGDTGETCCDWLIGGVAVRVVTGRGTEFEYFDAHPEGGGWAEGRVVDSETHAGVSGKVLVSAMPRDPDDPANEVVMETQLRPDGSFAVEFGGVPDGGRFQASYLGQYPWAPCESEVIEA